MLWKLLPSMEWIQLLHFSPCTDVAYYSIACPNAQINFHYSKLCRG